MSLVSRQIANYWKAFEGILGALW